MEKLSVEVEADVDVTPEELAILFWSMDQYEMRRFFNKLADGTTFTDFSSQLFAVANDNNSCVTLDAKARNFMREIGDVVGPHIPGQGDQHV